MESKSTHELLIVITNQGHTDQVMAAARSAGATGGTSVHAKGTGTDLAHKFFGVSIAAERELVFILVKADDRREIMKAVMTQAGMQTAAQSLVFSLPVWYPQAVQIGCELEDLQKAVGGDIEATYPFNEPVALVMHDEGKLVGKDLNRALRDDDGDIYDIIAGDFLVVGLGEDDFCSLSPELMKQFEEHFHQPETFVRMGRSIMALPLPDDMVKKEDAPVKADSVPHKSNPDRDVL